MKYAKKIGLGAVITVTAAFLMLLWAGFDREAFLYDDNRLQWFPVIERAYEQLLETGEMPDFSFYLAKGMNLAEPGYYSLTNPFMLAAFLLSRALPGGFSVISIYIAMMTGLGSAVMFALCKRLTGSGKIALLSVAALLSCGTFLAFNYWYYIFNNLLFIPLLLYAFVSSTGKKREFFICGIILAAELYCGNVQYTCYHYIVFCIMSLAAAVYFKKRSIIAMLSNIAVGIGLSLPIFIMLLGAASGFDNGEFLEQPLYIAGILANFFIPGGLLGTGEKALPIPNVIVMNRGDRFIFYTASCLAPVLIYSALCIARAMSRLKSSGGGKAEDIIPMTKSFFGKLCRNERSVMILGISCALIFFTSFCNGGIAALVLSVIPVINRFRYLFKAFFVMLPLLVPLTAVCLGKLGGKARKAAFACCIGFTALGMVNNFPVTSQVRKMFDPGDMTPVSAEAAELSGYVQAAGMDLGNYRSVCLLSNDLISNAMFECSKNNSRNFPAYMGYFTLSAYEVSLGMPVLRQFDSIYAPEAPSTSYANAGTVKYFYDSCKNDPERTARQLRYNSVKYLIVQREGVYPPGTSEDRKQIYRMYDNFTGELLEVMSGLPGITAEPAGEFSPGYDLIVLEGVDSLCTSSGGAGLPLTDQRMDKLLFTPDGSDSCTLSINYNECLTASHTAEDGSVTPLEVAADDEGNCLIRTGGLTDGSISIEYDYPVFTAALVMEAAVSLLLLAVCGVMIFGKE